MPDNDYKPTTFRTTGQQREEMKSAAERTGMGLSAWVRDICLAAAGKSHLAKQMGVAREKHEQMLEQRKAERKKGK